MNKRINWAGLLLEAMSIVFAVLLALGVNEWREARREQQTVALALASIQREMEGNRLFLDRRLPYYQQVYTELDSLVAVHGEATSLRAVDVPSWRGFNPPILRRSSYEAAITTQAFSHMDFQTADALARLYSFQGFFEKLVEQVMAAALQGEYDTLREARLIFQEMNQVGGELKGYYGEMQRYLEAQAG